MDIRNSMLNDQRLATTSNKDIEKKKPASTASRSDTLTAKNISRDENGCKLDIRDSFYQLFERKEKKKRIARKIRNTFFEIFKYDSRVRSSNKTSCYISNRFCFLCSKLMPSTSLSSNHNSVSGHLKLGTDCPFLKLNFPAGDTRQCKHCSQTFDANDADVNLHFVDHIWFCHSKQKFIAAHTKKRVCLMKMGFYIFKNAKLQFSFGVKCKHCRVTFTNSLDFFSHISSISKAKSLDASHYKKYLPETVPAPLVRDWLLLELVLTSFGQC